MKHEFRVNEYSSYFAVEHTPTGREHAMSDGVDALTTPTGRNMKPGSEYFRATWEKVLNDNPAETREAYFPELEE